jgi:small redox-active disulfide protein 2
MSKVIKILGTGCPKCKATAALVEEVVKENNMDAEIIKVEDIVKIMEYNVISTPVLVIDEQITIKGRVPRKSEIIELLKG